MTRKKSEYLIYKLSRIHRIMTRKKSEYLIFELIPILQYKKSLIVMD